VGVVKIKLLPVFQEDQDNALANTTVTFEKPVVIVPKFQLESFPAITNEAAVVAKGTFQSAPSGQVVYQFSLDNGASWHAFTPQLTGLLFEGPLPNTYFKESREYQVVVRAQYSGSTAWASDTKTVHINNAVPVIAEPVVTLASDTLTMTCKAVADLSGGNGIAEVEVSWSGNQGPWVKTAAKGQDKFTLDTPVVNVTGILSPWLRAKTKAGVTSVPQSVPWQQQLQLHGLLDVSVAVDGVAVAMTTLPTVRVKSGIQFNLVITILAKIGLSAMDLQIALAEKTRWKIGNTTIDAKPATTTVEPAATWSANLLGSFAGIKQLLQGEKVQLTVALAYNETNAANTHQVKINIKDPEQGRLEFYSETFKIQANLK
jgi:hypothetical protein